MEASTGISFLISKNFCIDDLITKKVLKEEIEDNDFTKAYLWLKRANIMYIAPIAGKCYKTCKT